VSKEYYLNLGSLGRHPFTLPRGWEPVYVAETDETNPRKTVGELLEEALPIERVRSLFSTPIGDRRVAVVVDDNTRPTPVKEVLGRFLDHFERVGGRPSQLTIIVACGTHLPMNHAILENRIGAEVLSKWKVVQHDARQHDLVPVKLDDGQVVKINRVAANADVKIGISSILPHPMAGYGGGPKIIMPGLCDADFIMRHHMMHSIHPASHAGSTSGNPFHEYCMSVTRRIGLDLSINCVYDREGNVARIVAGTLDEAFSQAVADCIQRLGIPIDLKADVAITSSHPHVHGIQLFKGLTPVDAVTKPDGAVLMAAPLLTPIPDAFVKLFLGVKAASRGDAVKYILGFMSQGKPFLADRPAEYNMAMAAAIRRPPVRTMIASSTLPAETASALGFEHVPTVDEGLARLAVSYPRAKVAIFPSGGLALPF
jgi:lactate racemase